MTGARYKSVNVPPLCEHFDPAQCSEACHEMAHEFDQWLRGELKKEGHEDVNPDKTNG